MFHCVLCGPRNSYKPLRSPEKSPFIGSTREDVRWYTSSIFITPLSCLCICICICICPFIGSVQQMFHCTHPRPSSDYKSQKEFSFSLLLITPPLSKYQIRYCKPPINQRSWVRCWSRKVLLARQCGVRQRQ